VELTIQPQIQKFTLRVYDNFHFMDEDESYLAGSFDTEMEAVLKAKNIIDGFVEDQFQPGMTTEALYHLFCTFGEAPVVLPSGFSPWGYARLKCAEICQRDNSAPE
jgi:hypothetical protein